MMLHFPTYGVSLPSLTGLRGLRGLGDNCVNADGTIDASCVASQSTNEAASIIAQQDALNASSYAVCESNRALNGNPLPDTCAQQFPANANVTVYTGYGNVQSGSGSPAGSYYYGQGGTPTEIDNQVATATAPASAAPVPLTVTVPTVNTALPASQQTPQSQANAAYAAQYAAANSTPAVTAASNASNPLLGTSNVAAVGTSNDLMIGSFDVTQNWMYLAGGAVALVLLLSLTKK